MRSVRSSPSSPRAWPMSGEIQRRCAPATKKASCDRPQMVGGELLSERDHDRPCDQSPAPRSLPAPAHNGRQGGGCRRANDLQDTEAATGRSGAWPTVSVGSGDHDVARAHPTDGTTMVAAIASHQLAAPANRKRADHASPQVAAADPRVGPAPTARVLRCRSAR